MDDGKFCFYSPMFKTEIELNDAIKSYTAMGLINLEKMIAYNGGIYTLDEFAEM